MPKLLDCRECQSQSVPEIAVFLPNRAGCRHFRDGGRQLFHLPFRFSSRRADKFPSNRNLLNCFRLSDNYSENYYHPGKLDYYRPGN